MDVHTSNNNIVIGNRLLKETKNNDKISATSPNNKTIEDEGMKDISNDDTNDEQPKSPTTALSEDNESSSQDIVEIKQQTHVEDHRTSLETTSRKEIDNCELTIQPQTNEDESNMTTTQPDNDNDNISTVQQLEQDTSFSMIDTNENVDADADADNMIQQEIDDLFVFDTEEEVSGNNNNNSNSVFSSGFSLSFEDDYNVTFSSSSAVANDDGVIPPISKSLFVSPENMDIIEHQSQAQGQSQEQQHGNQEQSQTEAQAQAQANQGTNNFMTPPLFQVDNTQVNDNDGIGSSNDDFFRMLPTLEDVTAAAQGGSVTISSCPPHLPDNEMMYDTYYTSTAIPISGSGTQEGQDEYEFTETTTIKEVELSQNQDPNNVITPSTSTTSSSRVYSKSIQTLMKFHEERQGVQATSSSEITSNNTSISKKRTRKPSSKYTNSSSSPFDYDYAQGFDDDEYSESPASRRKSRSRKKNDDDDDDLYCHEEDEEKEDYDDDDEWIAQQKNGNKQKRSSSKTTYNGRPSVITPGLNFQHSYPHQDTSTPNGETPTCDDTNNTYPYSTTATLQQHHPQYHPPPQRPNNSSSPFIGCKCKFSRCLKLYCECFQRKKLCDPNYCYCRNCLNTPQESGELGQRTIAIQNILARRPDAFEERVKVVGEGCKCKKNKCLKKYCDCFRNNLKCDPFKCRCIDCKNLPSFGNNGSHGSTTNTTENLTTEQQVQDEYAAQAQKTNQDEIAHDGKENEEDLIPLSSFCGKNKKKTKSKKKAGLKKTLIGDEDTGISSSSTATDGDGKATAFSKPDEKEYENKENLVEQRKTNNETMAKDTDIDNSTQTKGKTKGKRKPTKKKATNTKQQRRKRVTSTRITTSNKTGTTQTTTATATSKARSSRSRRNKPASVLKKNTFTEATITTTKNTEKNNMTGSATTAESSILSEAAKNVVAI